LRLQLTFVLVRRAAGLLLIPGLAADAIRLPAAKAMRQSRRTE
jgi:hypothetical protein